MNQNYTFNSFETLVHILIFTLDVFRYKFVENILEKRMPHRENHLAYANACNELVAGGAHKDVKTDNVSGGLLMFKAQNADVVENFAKNELFVGRTSRSIAGAARL